MISHLINAPSSALVRALLAMVVMLCLLTGIDAYAQSAQSTIAVQPEARVPPPGDDDPGAPPLNAAMMISQTVPSTMTAGGVYTVTVTMKNTGNTVWASADGYILGSRNPYDNSTWGGSRAALPSSVESGGLVQFSFQVTAPAAAGNYNFQWAMLREGVEWFGSPSTNLIVNVVAPSRVNASTVVAQSVPAQMTAGQTYLVSVVMQNTGTTTWTTADQYSFGIPTTDGVQLWNSGRVPLSGPVAPGGQVAFNFNVVAPQAGSYNFWGVMVQDGVEWFGASSYVPVNVSAGPSNNAQFVSQNVPATMIPGQPYAVTVVMQNIGTTTWTAHGNTGLAAANPLGNNTWSVVRIDQPTTTAPGQTASYTFQVTAPASQGSYNFQWKMVQDGVEWFGAETPNLAIQVTTNSDTVTYIHTDALGSPVARSDSAGDVIAASRTSYEPYGRTALGATPTIGFTGHVNDADTGLVYMQQRYYDPVAGRFLSVDPIPTDANTGASFGHFAYANNNPYKYIDTDGRQAKMAGNSYCESYGCEGQSQVGFTDPIQRIKDFIRNSGQEIANQVADEVGRSGVLESKMQADRIYLTNSDPNLKVNVNAALLTVRALGPWLPDQINGGLRAPGYVTGTDYWVHGQITIHIRTDGTVHIFDQPYHYNMHADFSVRGIARNIGTFIGEPKAHWNNTPFTIHYNGEARLMK